MYSVLIVDDEPLMLKFMADNLSRIDSRWTVTGQSEDGLQALEMMKTASFDLVITDIRMPEMDGLALARHIQENHPSTKVIIVSGFDEFQYAQEAVRCNVHDYLLKPLMDDKIREALDRVAKSIEKQHALDVALKTMNSLPDNSTEELVSNFISALIEENHFNIKTLYPLIYGMKLHIMDGIAAVLLLSPDESSILMSRKSITDMPVYRMILHQKALEVTKSDPLVPVCYDKYENTVLLIAGEDADEIASKCRRIYENICRQLETQSNIRLICAYGEPVEDILQLRSSYVTAFESLNLSLAGASSPIPPNRYISQRHFLHGLHETIKTIDADLSGRDSALLLNDLMHYAALLPDSPGTEKILRFGLYLVNQLAWGINSRQEKLELSLMPMIQFLSESEKSAPTEKKEIALLYQSSVLALTEDMVSPPGKEYGVLSDMAREYICMHYNEPISLAVVADVLGVSASYLCDVFHKNIGETYSKFLTRIRMEQAALLLKSNPDEKIYKVSEQVGFISVMHFNTVFKQHFNMTPREFQQKKKC